MRRKDREVTDFNTIVGIIDECEIIRIGLSDGDFPYIVPVNFAYTVEGSEICFYIHGAMAGKKYDMLTKKPYCSFEMDIPLEINLNGMTWTIPTRLSYPCEEFWRVAGEVGNKVVIGYDAHWPEFFQETKYMEKALEFVKKYNLNLVDPTKLL